MNPNFDLFPDSTEPNNSNSFNPFSQLIDQLTDYEPQIHDRETGFTMTLEQITVEMPIELNISINNDSSLTLFSSAPTQTTETTIFPVFHRMTLTVVPDDGQ